MGAVMKPADPLAYIGRPSNQARALKLLRRMLAYIKVGAKKEAKTIFNSIPDRCGPVEFVGILAEDRETLLDFNGSAVGKMQAADIFYPELVPELVVPERLQPKPPTLDDFN